MILESVEFPTASGPAPPHMFLPCWTCGPQFHLLQIPLPTPPIQWTTQKNAGGVPSDSVSEGRAGYSPMTRRKNANAFPPVILMMSVSE